MGLNMPATTCVFTSMRKWDGESNRCLLLTLSCLCACSVKAPTFQADQVLWEAEHPSTLLLPVCMNFATGSCPCASYTFQICPLSGFVPALCKLLSSCHLLQLSRADMPLSFLGA